MSYKLVIAEKPSVAQSIAKVIGADKREDGYLEGKQNADATLHLLEQMLEALTTHWSLTDSVLYHRMAPETKAIQSHELIPVLLNGLETDPQCAYLREHPKFREIIDKYKNK